MKSRAEDAYCGVTLKVNNAVAPTTRRATMTMVIQRLRAMRR